MKNKKEELEKYEGMLWDLENSNRLSNPGSQKAKDEKAKKLKDKIRRLKRDIQKEGSTIRITKSQLREIIKEACISYYEKLMS
tara:strand:- start:320 stop:568 length:249 start_codon:yes stop_codon:yes gene_type:complete